MGEKRKTRAGGDSVVHQAVPPAPDDIVACAQLEAVLRLNIVRVEKLTEGAGEDPPCSVKIAQDLEGRPVLQRSEEHTSELQSRPHLVCRLLLEKKKNVMDGACLL